MKTKKSMKHFSQNRGKGIPFSATMLREKASYFYKKLGMLLEDVEETCTASDGLLSRLKWCYNIQQLSICGEKVNAKKSKRGATEIQTQISCNDRQKRIDC